MNRLVIQWPRLGPYHLARLRATHRLLEAQGIELIALETASDDNIYEWRLENQDEPFRRVQAFPGRTFESISPWEMHAGIVRVLNDLDPDAVAIHTYSLPDSRACLRWCRAHRRGAVVMTDSKVDDAPRSALRERIKAEILGGFDASVTAGSASKEYLAALGFSSDRIWLGYDVVDNDYFASRAAASEGRRDLPGLDSDEPFFLASNRFIERKNLHRLLDAYAGYRTGHRGAADAAGQAVAADAAPRPWRLIMLGDGPLRRKLKSHASEGVVFPGFRQIDEIPAYYARASAFVHTALVDQWALVVNEAMACGLPVIVSTGAGSHRDLVRAGENGFAFEAQDTAALESHLTALASAPNLEAMGKRSREIIAEWSPDLFAASMSQAASAAAEHGHRRFGLVLRALLATMRFAGRSTTSFHAIES